MYEVKDAATGTDFSHKQESDGKTVKGEYKVLLPDGRNQVVTYTADDGGYNAEVKYDGEAQQGGGGGNPAGGGGGANGYPSGGPSSGPSGYPSSGPSGGSSGYPSGGPKKGPPLQLPTRPPNNQAGGSEGYPPAGPPRSGGDGGPSQNSYLPPNLGY